ncbi:MAG TPA: DUF4145 domain-containing protein [Terriglobia bacterium]|nr:DUF4145 domain-containing protein [Terriglobia bacterium]
MPDGTNQDRRPEGLRQPAFELLVANSLDFLLDESIRIGERRCPNMTCRTALFVVWKNNIIARCYPALRIDFDATNIPRPVVAALEQAITCHASECFIAAAIMVRKTLEELSRDRAAQGKDLKERIRDLGTKIVLPKELLDGLDDLRLLGNDAAHIESREYDQVGKEEVEIGIEFTKEVLKATYQYSALLNRLRALKKAPP